MSSQFTRWREARKVQRTVEEKTHASQCIRHQSHHAPWLSMATIWLLEEWGHWGTPDMTLQYQPPKHTASQDNRTTTVSTIATAYTHITTPSSPSTWSAVTNPTQYYMQFENLQCNPWRARTRSSRIHPVRWFRWQEQLFQCSRLSQTL